MVYRYLATSSDPLPTLVRKLRRGWHTFTLPAPRVIVVPFLVTYVSLRSLYYTLKRLFVCEPLLKAYCKSYGRNVRTTGLIHWIQGKGDIILGDNVEVRGQCKFAFAARFVDRPEFIVGSNTNIGHGCEFTIGKRIKIGNDCLVAADVAMFDSSGHPSDPAARLAGLPLADEDVRPITIGDNVWIGQRSIISPGCTIGDNSIVSAGSVVIGDVPANVVVAGHPARKIAALQPPPAKAAATSDAPGVAAGTLSPQGEVR